MKFLHTADWHLGKNLFGRQRYEEFAQFLDWLWQAIQEHSVDALLVAGDIFDTCTPSHRAQELYYHFLSRVSSTHCRHVVVIGGNHDSPTFLDAPKPLLQALNVYVVGAQSGDLEDEVLVLSHNGCPEAIVCAVPYLRDKDLRIAEPGDSIERKNAKLLEGLRQHYANVCEIAEKKQAAFQAEGNKNVPIIGMGHLFAAGGRTLEGDGVRELYVGSLAYVGADVFPPSMDYVALGHLHVPQTVGGHEHIRYSGSPIPMGFGEAGQEKQVLLVDCERKQLTVHPLAIPCFQELVRVSGDLPYLVEQIDSLKAQQSSAWLEVEYLGSESASHLQEVLDEAVQESAIEIRRIQNLRVRDLASGKLLDESELMELDVHDVFHRCLDVAEIPDDERDELSCAYVEIVRALQEKDVHAEGGCVR